MGWLEEHRTSLPTPQCHISIPLWDDWKFRLCRGRSRCCRISIPLWDDWKLNCVVLTEFLDSFQFHYGMIGSACFANNPSKLGCFNSTMGWLEERIACTPSAWFRMFQFHYGMIGSSLNRMIWKSPLSFNSTMGWLEGRGRLIAF